VSDSDLLVLAPWAIFVVGVALLVVRTVTRNHDNDRRGERRRGRFRRR
jgi:Na+-transporting NADH:ubiquinone oxidoreductase subunit NqrD